MTALLASPLPEFVNSAFSLIVAFVLGTMIGAERQYRQRTAGLRTNVLVAVGAAAFVDLGMRLEGTRGAVSTVAYVISGVGFLGAGVIMKEGMNVRGLNTAATLWCSAAVGAFAGADFPLEACFVTVAILSGNTLLRPLVNAINRVPIDESQTEATYEVQVTVPAEHAGPRPRPSRGTAGGGALPGRRHRGGGTRRGDGGGGGDPGGDGGGLRRTRRGGGRVGARRADQPCHLVGPDRRLSASAAIAAVRKRPN